MADENKEKEEQHEDDDEVIDENDLLKRLEDMVDKDTLNEARKHTPIVVSPVDGIFPKLWQNIIYYFLLTLVLVLSADGFIQGFINTPFYMIILYVYIFVLIEYFIRKAIKSKFLMTYMMSFSTIMVPFSLGIFVGLYFLLNLFLPIEAYIGRLIIIYFIMSFVRMLVNLYITRKVITKRFFGQKGK